MTSSTTNPTEAAAPGQPGAASGQRDIELAQQHNAAPDESSAAMAAVVDIMLAAAGLRPDAIDREKLIATYAMFKPVVDALYAGPEARYEIPALVFQAAPKLTPWRP